MQLIFSKIHELSLFRGYLPVFHSDTKYSSWSKCLLSDIFVVDKFFTDHLQIKNGVNNTWLTVYTCVKIIVKIGLSFKFKSLKKTNIVIHCLFVSDFLLYI